MSQQLSRHGVASALAPRKRPRQQRSQETVEAILEGAHQMFAAHGYPATTGQIAARAGVSVGTLYQYFPNKDSLLLELIDQRLQQGITALAVRITAAACPHVPAAIEGLVEALLQLYRQEAFLIRMLMDEGKVLATSMAFGRATHLTLSRALASQIAQCSSLPVERIMARMPIVVQMADGMCRQFTLETPWHMSADAFQREVGSVLTTYLGQTVGAGGTQGTAVA